MWINIAKPIYSLIVNGGSNAVVASSSNEFALSLSNYATDDPRLSYSWQFSPIVISPSIYMATKPDNATVVVSPGGFNSSTTYQLIVSIALVGYPTSKVVQ
jgi:hypothetical protein